MNLFTKQKYTHTHREQTDGYQKEKRGENILGIWINRYTLLHIKKQQGPSVSHRELYLISYNNL